MKHKSNMLLAFNVSLIVTALLYVVARPLITLLDLCRYLGGYCEIATRVLYNDFALGLLIAGLAFASWRLIAGYANKSRYLSVFHPYENGIGKLNSVLAALDNRYKVFLADDEEPIAFSSGIFNKSIYISTGIVNNLADGELAALLNHETAHLNNNDLFNLSLARFLSDLFFFVPGIVVLYGWMEAQAEYRADFEAAKLAGAKTVVSAILKIAHYKINRTYVVASFADGRTDALNRINKLEGRPVSYRISARILSLTMAALIVLSVLTATASATIKIGPVCRMHNTGVTVSHLK